jgi:lipopolysaccharide/colanic/teichoic acid biosynthesis glycosyltransferase
MSTAVKITKRLIDIFGAFVGLALTAPLFPVIAAAIYWQSPGPVFLRQRRAGRLLTPGPGEPPVGPGRFRFAEFCMLKFRTMRLDAEKLSGPVLASADDPRVLPIGRLLRKSRLDELPQLLNVLRGDMSLVGPRPERPELINSMTAAIPLFEERMRDMKPGLTGLAQVSLGYTGRLLDGSKLAPLVKEWSNPFQVPEASGALADDLRLKLLYDVAYAAATERFFSFFRWEITILVRTPFAMLRGLGR